MNKPDLAFPKLSNDTERLAHISTFAEYYSKFSAEKIADYILGSKFNTKTDLERPYVSSLEQTIGEEDFKIGSLCAQKISSKTYNVSKKRTIDISDPELSQINIAIDEIKTLKENATGKDKFHLQKTLIELYKDRQLIYDSKHTQQRPAIGSLDPFDEERHFDKVAQIDFTNFLHIKETVKIASDLGENPNGATLVDELTSLIRSANNITEGEKELIYLRMQGYTNIHIKPILAEKYNMNFTTDYYSTLFTKICKRIAEWGKMKQEEKCKETNKYAFAVCTRCGEKKLISDTNFVKKHTSPTGFAA